MFIIYKSNGIEEIEIAKTTTKEQAERKMTTLVKRETKDSGFVKMVGKTKDSWTYEYGLYNRWFVIREVEE